MGLWVLSESLRTWSDQRLSDATLPALLAGAAEAPALRTVVDINDPRLLAPARRPTHAGPDPAAGRARPASRSRARRSRSPARSWTAWRSPTAATSGTAAALAGRDVDVVHLVGGGSQNELLCQLTADALGVPVLAGPAEAAALGNGLVQARALGADLPDLAAMRALIRRTHDVRRYRAAQRPRLGRRRGAHRPLSPALLGPT